MHFTHPLPVLLRRRLVSQRSVRVRTYPQLGASCIQQQQSITRRTISTSDARALRDDDSDDAPSSSSYTNSSHTASDTAAANSSLNSSSARRTPSLDQPVEPPASSSRFSELTVSGSKHTGEFLQHRKDRASSLESRTSESSKPRDSYLSLSKINDTRHLDPNAVVEANIKHGLENWDARSSKTFGKPLTHLEEDSGAMGDPLDRKLNAILKANGAMPEWMELERRIEAEYAAAINELKFVWNELICPIQYATGVSKRSPQNANPTVYRSSETKEEMQLRMNLTYPSVLLPALTNYFDGSEYGPCWGLALREFHSHMCQVNGLIDDFNCMIPNSFQRQKIYYKFYETVKDIEAFPPDPLRFAGQFEVRERNIYQTLRKPNFKTVDGTAKIQTSSLPKTEGKTTMEIEEIYRSLSPKPRFRARPKDSETSTGSSSSESNKFGPLALGALLFVGLLVGARMMSKKGRDDD